MDAVSEVKARLNIEDVLAEYVQLKRAGRNYKALSPFGNEKTASFVVSPEKQIWHDFSSGKGGDMFGFVMEVEGLDFKGALELLARKAGVDLEQFRGTTSSGNSKLKARALEALELAARFYQKQLTVNKPALDYLINKRKFSRGTVLTWRLGYSPNTGHALTDFLTKHGFTTDEMKRAGLIVMSGSPRDMFRGRIMVPLCDANGAVVGFTARLLADEPNSPKYINTPSTMVYDKGRQVYGLHMAKESMRKSGFVVVVEGNMDVIASHQAGVANVVASAGTAMTENHLKALKRFTGDVRLSFDSDRAGVAATERVIPLAQNTEVNLRIITIDGAKDPDELIQKSIKSWQQAIESAKNAPDWLIDNYKNLLDLSSATGKREFTDALLTTIRRLRDPVEQEHYLRQIAELTQTSLEAVQSKLAGKVGAVNQPPLRKIKVDQTKIDRAALEYQRLQDHFLAMVIASRKLRKLLGDLKPEYFSLEPAKLVFEFLAANPDYDGKSKLPTKLQPATNYVKIIGLQFEELYKDLPPDDLLEQASQLKQRLIVRYAKIEKQKLADAMQNSTNSEELQDLMKRADSLNQLIK